MKVRPLLAGATPYFLNSLPQHRYAPDLRQLSADVWKRTQLIFTCSPGNPTGAVMTLAEWKHCSSFQINTDSLSPLMNAIPKFISKKGKPPLGALERSTAIGTAQFRATGDVFELVPNDPTYPACAPGSLRATPPSFRNTCSIAPITAAP